MMTFGRKLFLIYILLFALASGLVVSYYSPSSVIMVITGTEAKRTDNDGIVSKINPADGNNTRDVYYISTRTPDGKIMMYRNEDTGWSFPWYFKFNSADIQSQVHSINKSENYAVIVSYGWRVNMFSMFKNIISIKEVPNADASTFSFYTLLAILSWLVWLLFIIGQTVGYIMLSRWREKKEFYG